MDQENQFFLRKLELDYGNKKAVDEIKTLSKEISWLKDWPKSRKAFWNGESFMWGNKVSKGRRDLIKQELSFLDKMQVGSRNQNNLDVGCGSHSYVTSIGYDISERMLRLNDNLVDRFVGDVEKKLPFDDNHFNSVTIVFLLNYIRNYSNLLNEVYRILQEDGKLVVVQPKEKVNSWQRQHTINNLGFKKWEKVLSNVGFKVKFYEKEGLGFFRCVKQKTI